LRGHQRLVGELLCIVLDGRLDALQVRFVGERAPVPLQLRVRVWMYRCWSAIGMRSTCCVSRSWVTSRLKSSA
jgi:hypothetical protein